MGRGTASLSRWIPVRFLYPELLSRIQAPVSRLYVSLFPGEPALLASIVLGGTTVSASRVRSGRPRATNRGELFALPDSHRPPHRGASYPPEVVPNTELSCLVVYKGRLPNHVVAACTVRAVSDPVGPPGQLQRHVGHHPLSKAARRLEGILILNPSLSSGPLPHPGRAAFLLQRSSTRPNILATGVGLLFLSPHPALSGLFPLLHGSGRIRRTRPVRTSSFLGLLRDSHGFFPSGFFFRSGFRPRRRRSVSS